MTRRPAPTRTLSKQPHLDQLKRQAKELLDGFRAGNPETGTEVRTHYRDADAATFALHDAQLTLARVRVRQLAEAESLRRRRHGAPPRGRRPRVEPDAEPWATPLAWTRRNGHAGIEAELLRAGAR